MAGQSFQEMLAGEKPVLVDFSAEWCGPCQMMPPILREVKNSLKDGITVLKVDIDKNQNLARQFHIQSVPTLMLFQNGAVKWRQSGVVPAHELKQIVAAHTTEKTS